jgi:mRNA-degrading endonuclease RelE of RelBE toxin-antitoxin system
VKSFTVLWRKTALDQLAEVWLASSDRQAINNAVAAIDALLATQPLGEMTQELSEGLRTTTAMPLRVIYAVQDDDKIVDVATVRLVDPPSG